MADRYENYKQLSREAVEGRDYQVRSRDRESGFIVIGPHAGGIEAGTSELTRAVASDDLSYYLFEGIKAEGNYDLRVTSTRFDEPRGLELVRSHRKAIAFHGWSWEVEKIYMGGRDEALAREITRNLRAAGFEVMTQGDPLLQGISPDNICNRCSSGAGVQVEVSRGLRRLFFKSLTPAGRRQTTEAFARFVGAVRAGVDRSDVIRSYG